MGLFDWIGNKVAQYQQPIAQQNYNYTRKARKTEWQDTVSSMNSAGINPALAYTSGPVQSDMQMPQQNINPVDMANTVANIGYTLGGIGKQEAERKQMNEVTELTKQQQISEQINQDLNIAKTFNEWADITLKDKQANWFDKRQAIEYKEIAERIANITSGTLLNRAKTSSEVTLQDLRKAETKYTNERGRGLNLFDTPNGSARILNSIFKTDKYVNGFYAN